MINEKKSIGLFSLISLQLFTVFPEYFLSISVIYLLTVVFLITYSVYGLILQKSVSETIFLILLMTCYLLINDDLLIFNFLTFNNSIVNDYFAFFTKLIICLVAAVYFLFIANSLKYQKLTFFEYLLIILFAVLGLMLLCSSNDLLIAYLAIELSSLASYILASFKKTSSYSIEGGIKYFIIGAVSSAFFLLGSSYIYGVSGTINFSDLNDLFSLVFNKTLLYNDYFDFSFIELGLSLIVFSLFIKLALAPFHLWSLDVYEGSPSSASFFFAVVTKLSIFVLLVRLCYCSFFTLIHSWQFYALWVGVFSIFVGSFGGLRQRKLKTLLAYSSTSHMGYALIAFSTGTFEGIQMLLLYMIVYMISGLCIWYIFLLLRVKKKNPLQKHNKELGDLVLLKNSNNALVLTFSLVMFSIAGIPPMVGFLAKMSVFLSAVGASLYFIALISILCSVISTFYYVRVIKILYFENLLVGKLYYPINSKNLLVFTFLIFLFLFLFIYPTILYLTNYKTILSLL